MKTLEVNELQFELILNALSHKIDQLTDHIPDCQSSVRAKFQTELFETQDLYNDLEKLR